MRGLGRRMGRGVAQGWRVGIGWSGQGWGARMRWLVGGGGGAHARWDEGAGCGRLPQGRGMARRGGVMGGDALAGEGMGMRHRLER
eukprot:1771904-Pyramimonas_sp.AAC.1